MIRTVLICTLCFVVGAVVSAAPFLIQAHIAHSDEVARGEGTMGPGITTAFGLLAAPIGGVVAVVVAIFAGRVLRSPKK